MATTNSTQAMKCDGRASRWQQHRQHDRDPMATA